MTRATMGKITAVMSVRRWFFFSAVMAWALFSIASIVFSQADNAPESNETPANETPDVPERPLLSTLEYEKRAAELRALYAKPSDQWPKPQIDPGVEFAELGPLPDVVHPKENPYSKEKAELGKLLFFDPRLSGSGQIACASCHDPELGWADGRGTSFGHDRQFTTRNSPSLNNIGHGKSFFWDGRAATLEEQALIPIANSKEMNAGEPAVILRRFSEQPEYVQRFKAVFGDEQITLERIAMAIATFERTIVSRPTKFSAFLSGRTDALSDAQVRGLHLFRTDARCINCHSGPNFTDEKFHNLGLSNYGRKLEDLGRYVVTRKPEDVGRFKTPSLRNVTRTSPYMHNGLFDMDTLLRLYNVGMFNLRPRKGQENDPLFPTKSELLKPLGLNKQDLEDLKAFLHALEEPYLRSVPPKLPGLHDPAATTRPAN